MRTNKNLAATTVYKTIIKYFIVVALLNIKLSEKNNKCYKFYDNMGMN